MTYDAYVPEVVLRLIGRPAADTRRMDYGHTNAVYAVTLTDGREVILRLNADPGVMKGTARNIAILRGLGLPVPVVMAEDRSRTGYPFDCMALERIPGRDLRYEMPQMAPAQLVRLADDIARCQRLVAALPEGDGYGWVPIGDRGPYRAWDEVVRRDLDEGLARVAARLPPQWAPDIRGALADLASYLQGVRPTCFLDDLTTKNVIVQGGRLQGIVDLDVVCYGDPLYTIALTRVAVTADVPEADSLYVDMLFRAGGFRAQDRRVVDLYSAIFALDFLGREESPETRERLRGLIGSCIKAK